MKVIKNHAVLALLPISREAYHFLPEKTLLSELMRVVLLMTTVWYYERTHAKTSQYVAGPLKTCETFSKSKKL